MAVFVHARRIPVVLFQNACLTTRMVKPQHSKISLQFSTHVRNYANQTRLATKRAAQQKGQTLKETLSKPADGTGTVSKPTEGKASPPGKSPSSPSKSKTHHCFNPFYYISPLEKIPPSPSGSYLASFHILSAYWPDYNKVEEHKNTCAHTHKVECMNSLISSLSVMSFAVHDMENWKTTADMRMKWKR